MMGGFERGCEGHFEGDKSRSHWLHPYSFPARDESYPDRQNGHLARVGCLWQLAVVRYWWLLTDAAAEAVQTRMP